jgi:hypothetical protein
MEESILTSTKKILGVQEDDTSFDLDIATYINSAFSNLQQLGLGPADGFVIDVEGAEEWADLDIESLPILAQVKTYIWLKVKSMFDPPATSYLVTAMSDQITEHEARLSALREATEWEPPEPAEPIFLEREVVSTWTEVIEP